MKNTLRSPASSFQSVLAAACLGALAVSAQAVPVLVTSFESSEAIDPPPSFANGNIVTEVKTSQGTWGGSTASVTSSFLAVTDTQSFDGTQSLRVTANTVATQYFAVSPDYYEYGATTASFQLKVLDAVEANSGNERNITAWHIYLGDSDQEGNMGGYSRLSFTFRWASVEGGDFNIVVGATGTGEGRPAYIDGTSNKSFTGSYGNLDLTAWNEVVLTLNPTEKTLDISIGGFTLPEAFSLNDNVTEDLRFTGFRFVVVTSSTSTAIAYYDYVQLLNPVPEPSTWALIGLGATFLTLAARRRRRN